MVFSKFRQPLSFRKYVTVLGAIAAAWVMLGVGGFWWLSAQSPLLLTRGGSHTAPNATVFVPRQAPLMVSLLTSPERLVELRRVLTPPGRRSEAQAEVSQLKRSFLLQTGINYDSDIRPWIGDEIAFAVADTDFDHDLTNGLQPGYLAAIATRDGDRAREFLELFWQRQALAGAKLVFEVSNGVQIIYAKTAPSIPASPQLAEAFATLRQQGQLATAVVGNRFVLLANHPQVLQQSIRNAQAAQANLTGRPDYQSSLRQLTAKRIGVVYGNLPQLFSWLGIASQANLTAFKVTAGSPHTQSLTAAIQLNRQGLRLKTALAPTSQIAYRPIEPDLNAPVEPLRYLPADTAMAASGRDLNQLWETLETELDFYETFPSQLQQLRQQIHHPAGNTQQLLKNWLKGDYALGQWDKDQDKAWIKQSGDRPDWILVVEHSAVADAAIAALDQLAEQQQLTVSPLSLQNRPVTVWSQFQTSVQARFRDRETTVETQILGLHTTVDGYDIFATSLPAMTAALDAPLRSLADTAQFNQAITPLQQPNDGYLYINWPQFRKTLTASVPWFSLLDTTARPILDAFQSIAVSSYGTQPHQKPGEILIQLADPQ